MGCESQKRQRWTHRTPVPLVGGGALCLTPPPSSQLLEDRCTVSTLVGEGDEQGWVVEAFYVPRAAPTAASRQHHWRRSSVQIATHCMFKCEFAFQYFRILILFTSN